MRSSTLPDRHSIAVSAGGRTTLTGSDERRALLFLGTGAGVICLLLALAAAVPYEPSPAVLGEIALLAASICAAAALWSLAESPSAWRGTSWAAKAATGAVAFQLGWLNRVREGTPAGGGIALGAIASCSPSSWGPSPSTSWSTSPRGERRSSPTPA